MIELKNVGYHYQKGEHVLCGITMDFTPGRIYGILGKNGVGKSTLLKIICGLLQPEGACRVNSLEPFKRQTLFLEQIIFIPETPYIADLSIDSLAQITAPFYSTFDCELFERILLEFEISRNQSMVNMSLGQQKKALIALAIACNTPILLMDEPTNGLDIPSKSSFRKLVASIVDENRTILISTHQVRDLENLIDSVVILDKEGVLLDQPISSIEERLSFRNVRGEEQPLYMESSVRGNWGVLERTSDEGELMGNVDLELLFNAVIGNKQRIHEIFKN